MINLTSVKTKLYEKKSWWWKLWNDVKDFDKIEAEYRQFLYLIATNSGKSIVPWSESLDEFWHQHILDTEKYGEDCQKIFGQFVHHNPHSPIGSEKQVKAFTETKQMYREAFKDKKKDDSSSAGCTTYMPVVFCASHDSSSHSHDSGGHHDSGHSCSGHSCHSCSGHSCSSCGSH